AFKHHNAVVPHQLIFTRRAVITGQYAPCSWLPAKTVRASHAMRPDRITWPGVIGRYSAFRGQTQHGTVRVVQIVGALTFKGIPGRNIQHAIRTKLQGATAVAAPALLGRQTVEQ